MFLIISIISILIEFYMTDPDENIVNASEVVHLLNKEEPMDYKLSLEYNKYEESYIEYKFCMCMRCEGNIQYMLKKSQVA